MDKTITILVVDDEKVQLETLKRGLRTRGFQVCTAINGRDALKSLNNSGKVDLVITDYTMPEMNGVELCDKIRDTFKNIPVIIMTAFGDKEIALDALRHGCNGFIDKPFTLDELMNLVNRVII